ncbi:MAG: hypothetical protein ACJAT7_003845 [Psychromonas sp.]|jgi:hypothetical protein
MGLILFLLSLLKTKVNVSLQSISQSNYLDVSLKSIKWYMSKLLTIIRKPMNKDSLIDVKNFNGRTFLHYA